MFLVSAALDDLFILSASKILRSRLTKYCFVNLKIIGTRAFECHVVTQLTRKDAF